jgi:hypothetical protein
LAFDEEQLAGIFLYLFPENMSNTNRKNTGRTRKKTGNTRGENGEA